MAMQKLGDVAQRVVTDAQDMVLLRTIRDNLNGVAVMMRDANARGYQLNVHFDIPNGVAQVQFVRTVPVSIDEA